MDFFLHYLQLISWAPAMCQTLRWCCEVTDSLWCHNAQEDMDIGTAAMLQGSELELRGGWAHCPHPTARRTECLKPCWLYSEVWGCHFSIHLWIWHCAFWALCLRVSCFHVVYFLVAQENQKSFRQSQEWIYRWVQETFTLPWSL